MTEQQRKALAIMALAEVFGRNMTEAGAKLFVAALDGIQAEAVERATRTLATSVRGMPSPVEVREACGESKPEDRAVLAWEVVIRAIVEVGGYRSPDFDDPVINGAIRILGGWPAICDQTIDEQDRFTRANFTKTYCTLLRTGISDELSAPLVGIADKHNATHRLEGYQGAVTVKTGLPWAGKPVKRLGEGRQGVPLLELKKP